MTQTAEVRWTAVTDRHSWLARRHSLPIELAMVLGLYAGYEATRGLVAGDAHVAVRHAQDVVSFERSLHIFVEGPVQHAMLAVPGLIGTLGFAYLTFHLTLTGGLLLWLHRRRPATYPLVRTTLLLATALAVVGYVVFPTAPPRLSHVGIVDTVSDGHVDLNKGLVSSLYNPFAAVPSLHVGYAVIVGASLARYAPHLITRLVGLGYPLFVVLVIVATGNHFLVDAAAGAAVAAIALLAARLLVTPRSAPRLPTSSPAFRIRESWRDSLVEQSSESEGRQRCSRASSLPGTAPSTLSARSAKRSTLHARRTAG